MQTRASKPLVTQPSATHHKQAPLSSVHLISPPGNYPNMHVHMDELIRKTTYNSCRFTYIIHQFIDIISAQTNKHRHTPHFNISQSTTVSGSIESGHNPSLNLKFERLTQRASDSRVGKVPSKTKVYLSYYTAHSGWNYSKQTAKSDSEGSN
ncbi:hypothetical protein GQ457_17G004960 [Hibiscus cannabinus]